MPAWDSWCGIFGAAQWWRNWVGKISWWLGVWSWRKKCILDIKRRIRFWKLKVLLLFLQNTLTPALNNPRTYNFLSHTINKINFRSISSVAATILLHHPRTPISFSPSIIPVKTSPADGFAWEPVASCPYFPLLNSIVKALTAHGILVAYKSIRNNFLLIRWKGITKAWRRRRCKTFPVSKPVRVAKISFKRDPAAPAMKSYTQRRPYLYLYI